MPRSRAKPKSPRRGVRQPTRERVLDLVRRGVRTVEDLAEGLGLTDNAVRVHLATLAHAGLVRSAGVLRSGDAGQPAAIFEITPAAHAAISRAYAPMLATLLDSLGAGMSRSRMDALMTDVGRRLARSIKTSGRLEERVQAVSALLSELGGVTDVENGDMSYTIRGRGCPLALVTAKRPAACAAVRSLVAEVTGHVVEEQCTRGDQPSCCFAIAKAG